MSRRVLIAALLLPLFSFALIGRAHAATAITPDDVTSALLTRAQLNNILSQVGVDASFSGSSDLDPQTGDRVGACRIYSSNSGFAAAICLFVNADGSRPDASLRTTILSGQALQNVALNTSLVDTVDNFSLLGSTGLADSDQLASFTATSSGVNLNVLGDVFTQGAVAGYVFFASTGDPDAGTMGGILGGQIGKLTS